MATVNLNGSITLDESPGLQVGGVASGSEDNNDNDVLVSSLPTSFSTRLNTLTSGDTIISAASKADLVSVSLAASETLSSIGFVDSSGNALPVYGSGTGVASGLSAVNGGAISLFADASSSGGLGTQMVVGVDTNGDIVLALYMGPGSTSTASTMWMALFEPISQPVTTNPDDAKSLGGLGVAAATSLEFNFNALPSGQNLFGIVGTTDAGLVVIGKTPVLNADGTYTNASNTINTSQGGGPTTIGVNNQMFDAGEGAYFTFVKSPNSNYLDGNLSATEADDADNILYTGGTLAVTSAFTKISQIQGNDLATMRITAKDLADSPQGKDFVTALGTGSGATITNVRVFDATGTKIEDTADLAHYNAAAVSVSITSGVATVAGLNANYRIEWDTSTPHDQVLVEAIAGKFDIGGFGSTQGNVTTRAFNNISYEDDGPSVTQGTPTDTTVLNTQDADTIGTASDSDTKGFASSFSVSSSSYGTDGAGTLVGSYALSLGSGAPNSGLTSEGSTIYLYLNSSGVVIGSTSTTQAGITTANTVFDVSVGSSSGDVTLNQYQEIDHATPGATSNYSSQQAVLANDKIILTGTATITDGDGDTATAAKTIDLGGNIKFDDDGPTATISPTVNTITLDETIGAKTGDANAATDDITLTNADPFAAAYGTPIGALSAVDLVDTTVTTGADSHGATTAVSLAIVGGSGASSGLMTSDGTAINLYLESNGTVTGRTVSASGSVVFAVKIDGSGNVSVAQYAGVKHPTTTNPDDSVDLSNKLNAVVKETDGDSDTATNSVGIGNAIIFQDDGPTLAVGNMIGTGTDRAQTGYWAGSTGTDGLGANGVDITLDAFTLIPPSGTPTAGTIVSFSENSPSPDSSGNYKWSGQLRGDFNNDGTVDITNETVGFTLTAYADSHYEVKLAAPVASTFNFDTADGALGAGGPDPVQTLYIPKPPATPDATIVFFSALWNALDAEILADVVTGSTDRSEASLQGPPLAAGIDARSMNVSTSGIGVGNNVLQGDTNVARGGTDESFVANPDIMCTSVTVNIDNSVGGYSYTGGERLEYRVVYDDGSFSNYTTLDHDVGLPNKGQPSSFTINTVAGKLIDAVQITMDYGDVKIPNIVFTQSIESLADSIKLDFTATISDKDGDSASDGFTALLNTSQAVGSLFDFVLAGTASTQDAFNVDLSSAKTKWEATGFDTGTLRDKLVFLGDATATATVDNSGANSIVTVTESGVGGQTTTVTVVGVDLLATDLTGLASVSVIA